MDEVKWVKLSVDTFSDEKVQLIESMPEGQAIMLMWLKLLCLAGRVNDGGYVYVGQNLPYTDEMLAVVFRQPVAIVRIALKTFEGFGMIELWEKGIFLTNWPKYQNMDALERARELGRQRQERYRAKQIEGSTTACNVTVTQSNASREKKEEGREKKEEDISPADAKAEKPKKVKVVKRQYADRVKLTDEEYGKLSAELGEAGAARCIEMLDTYKAASGRTYQSDYHAILSWVIAKYRNELGLSAWKDRRQARQETNEAKLRQLYEAEEERERREAGAIGYKEGDNTTHSTD